AEQGRVEVGRPVGRPDDEDVGRDVDRLVESGVGGQQGIDGVDERTPDPQGGRRLLERLELDEQLVDYARDPLTLTVAVAAGSADGVELLDEPDGPALASGVLAEGLEVG